MIRTTSVLAALLLAAGANAQWSFTGSPLTQNFDTLPSTGAATNLSSTVGAQFALNTVLSTTTLDGWQVAKTAGSGTTPMQLVVDNGGGTSGAVYSYGLGGTPPSTDRALGALASGSNTAGFGVEIVNNSANVLSEFTLGFDAEVYRSSTSVQNRLTFAWGLSGGSATSSTFLTDTSLTVLAAGDVVGPASVSSNGVINPPLSAPVAVTVTGLSWAPGQSLFLRWQDFNDQGNDAGLAIDNVSFTAIPSPGSAALLALGGLVVARRRR